MEPRDLQSQEDAKPLQSAPIYLHGKCKLDSKVACLKLRHWWVLLLALLAVIFILCIGCLGSPHWMDLDNDAVSITGGLMRCSDCPGAWDQASYDEIAHYLSDTDYSAGLQDLFEELRDGGAAYVFFELLSLLFLNLWAGAVMLLLVNNKNPKVNLALYAFPGLAFLLHFLALVIWAGVSKAKFDENCSGLSLLSGGRPTVCAGPALALSIATLVFYIPVIGVFYFAFCKAKSLDAPRRDAPPQSEFNQAPEYSNVPPPNYSNVPPQADNQGFEQPFSAGIFQPRSGPGGFSPQRDFLRDHNQT